MHLASLDSSAGTNSINDWKSHVSPYFGHYDLMNRIAPLSTLCGSERYVYILFRHVKRFSRHVNIQRHISPMSLYNVRYFCIMLVPWHQECWYVCAGLWIYVWNAWGKYPSVGNKGIKWANYTIWLVCYIVRMSLLHHLCQQLTVLVGMHCAHTKHHLMMAGEIGWPFL